MFNFYVRRVEGTRTVKVTGSFRKNGRQITTPFTALVWVREKRDGKIKVEKIEPENTPSDDPNSYYFLIGLDRETFKAELSSFIESNWESINRHGFSMSTADHFSRHRPASSAHLFEHSCNE